MKFLQYLKWLVFLIMAIAILILAIKCGGSSGKETRTASRTEISSASGNTTSDVVPKLAELAAPRKPKKKVASARVPAHKARARPQAQVQPEEALVERASADSVVSRPDFDITLPKVSERRVGLGLLARRCKVLSVTVSPESEMVTVRVRVTSLADYPMDVLSQSFSLVVNDKRIESGNFFNDILPARESIEKELTFLIPAGPSRVKLHMEVYGDRADIGLDLVPPKPKSQPASPQGSALPPGDSV